MLTKIVIRNFKRFDDVEIDLSQDIGAPIVFIGPNNSGKTTALQALSMWQLGLRYLAEKRAAGSSAKKRLGVTVNRRDLTHVPVPSANLLWRGTQTHRGKKVAASSSGSPIRIEIVVSGVAAGHEWTCGLEFDPASEETFLCRPLRLEGQANVKVDDCKFSDIPDQAHAVRLAFLPPMSGLASVEPRWEPGRIDVLLGEGQTAQVVRNLCAQVYKQTEANGGVAWNELVRRVKDIFGVELNPPEYLQTRGEVTMSYRDVREKCELDLSASGRGLQQTILLLAYILARPGSTLLLDEPDAHLEILRQRQIFTMITEVAQANGSQVIAASHSEVVLDEGASRGGVIAFIGKPHRVNGQKSQVRKALNRFGFENYYKAELKGWVLYTEEATDLHLLRAFAKRLKHREAIAALSDPFVQYLGTNLPNDAREHFNAVREAWPSLVGFALFDRLDKQLQTTSALTEYMWTKREIENYVCSPDLLRRVAARVDPEVPDLFGAAAQESRITAMESAIREISDATNAFGKPNIWSADAKASDEVLEPIFRKFAEKLGAPMPYRKRDFHSLVGLLEPNEIDAEVGRVLDTICEIAAQARPYGGGSDESR